MYKSDLVGLQLIPWQMMAEPSSQLSRDFTDSSLIADRKNKN